MPKKIYYVANARMPNEKAHGIQIAKTCESFIEAGIPTVLVVPGRATYSSTSDIRDYYHLRVQIPVVRVPVPDLYLFGPTGFFISSLFFIAGYLVYLWIQILRGGQFLLYTIDMDNFSFPPLALVPRSVYCEMHGPKTSGLWRGFFFKRVKGVIAINALIKESLLKTFQVPESKFCVEPNGVDIAVFSPRDKFSVRKELSLPPETSVVLYVGRPYGWKGLMILAQAARLEPTLCWYVVGGTRAEFAEAGLSDFPENLIFAGSFPQKEIPNWLAAADVLVLLGTKENRNSYRYTAPMKLFEYMAAKRPIVASRTEALQSLTNDSEVWWYEPDHPETLARTVQEALEARDRLRVEVAYARAQEHSWQARAKRIIKVLNK